MIRQIDNRTTKGWRLEYVKLNSLVIQLANHFIDKTSPIIFGEAPPEDFIHAHGRRMLVDGSIDRQGIACLGPSVASTKVKKLKPSTHKEAASRHQTSPILIDDKSQQPQTIPQKQKLVPVVELRSRPPPRPLMAGNRKKTSAPAARKVIPIDMSSNAQASSGSDAEDEFKEDQDPLESDTSEYNDEVATSRKCKVKATRGYRSQKRHVPSSDIELPHNEGNNVRGKGKGKATGQNTSKGQKTTKKVRYVSEDSLQPCTQRGKYYIGFITWSSTNDFVGLPKPKQVVPGSSKSAHQAALYSEGKRQLDVPGGSNTSQDAPRGSLDTSQEVLASQGGLDISQVAQQGRLRGPRTSRWDLPVRGQIEDTFTQASDHLQVPSPTSLSPSPQS